MIVVFGSLNIDMVMPVPHFPEIGETVLCSSDYVSRSGGKGANQAVAAVRAGAKVAMIGKVGDDAFGRRSIHNLKSQSVWTSGIGISERPTGCSTIAVDAHGRNKVIVAPGANIDITADQVPDEVLSSKNLLLTQMEGAPHETFTVLARARRLGATCILNASPAGVLTQEILKTIHYLIVNEVEAQQLAHGFSIAESDPGKLALHLSALGNPLTCIITLEGKGCVAAQGPSLWIQPTLSIAAVDTTGAGDCFCGIFAACLQMEMSWLEALKYANAGASLSCLGLGAQAGIPFFEDIQKTLSRLPIAQKLV